MPAVFKTLGPFRLPLIAAEPPYESLARLWDSPRGKGGSIPRLATGVYVLAVRGRHGLVPIYVGKTDRGFANRLQKHSIFKKIRDELHVDEVHLFLLARITPVRGDFITMKKDRKTKRVKTSNANTELEFLLIGSCLRLNSGLLNMQEKSFLSGLDVPGYLGAATKDEPKGVIDFRKMLNTK